MIHTIKKNNNKKNTLYALLLYYFLTEYFDSDSTDSSLGPNESVSDAFTDREFKAFN